ncbi:hypothetical protein HK097_002368 [Rhizophlyctis rosea]|uniref:Rho-GAP domain-containing protein n=1 Tax=Rhizophlyctis rosea TaxID=64517 RepID=A0AAD5S531_9FUNG|nr:hypothetical protein HK097_002368 [Rhizophlyctis rosea]
MRFALFSRKPPDKLAAPSKLPKTEPLPAGNVYQVSLEELLDQGGRSEGEIPIIMEEFFEGLSSAPGCDEVGIYRTSAAGTKVRELRASVENTGHLCLDGIKDVNIPANAFKQLVRELPDGLVNADLTNYALTKIVEKQPVYIIFRDLVTALETANKTFLLRLLDYLVLIKSHADKNCMDAKALGVVWAPNIFRLRDDQDTDRVASDQRALLLTKVLIQKDLIIPPPNDYASEVDGARVKIDEKRVTALSSIKDRSHLYVAHTLITSHRWTDTPNGDVPKMTTRGVRRLLRCYSETVEGTDELKNGLIDRSEWSGYPPIQHHAIAGDLVTSAVLEELKPDLDDAIKLGMDLQHQRQSPSPPSKHSTPSSSIGSLLDHYQGTNPSTPTSASKLPKPHHTRATSQSSKSTGRKASAKSSSSSSNSAKRGSMTAALASVVLGKVALPKSASQDSPNVALHGLVPRIKSVSDMFGELSPRDGRSFSLEDVRRGSSVRDTQRVLLPEMALGAGGGGLHDEGFEVTLRLHETRFLAAEDVLQVPPNSVEVSKRGIGATLGVHERDVSASMDAAHALSHVGESVEEDGRKLLVQGNVRTALGLDVGQRTQSKGAAAPMSEATVSAAGTDNDEWESFGSSPLATHSQPEESATCEIDREPLVNPRDVLKMAGPFPELVEKDSSPPQYIGGDDTGGVGRINSVIGMFLDDIKFRVTRARALSDTTTNRPSAVPVTKSSAVPVTMSSRAVSDSAIENANRAAEARTVVERNGLQYTDHHMTPPSHPAPPPPSSAGPASTPAPAESGVLPRTGMGRKRVSFGPDVKIQFEVPSSSEHDTNTDATETDASIESVDLDLETPRGGSHADGVKARMEASSVMSKEMACFAPFESGNSRPDFTAVPKCEVLRGGEQGLGNLTPSPGPRMAHQVTKSSDKMDHEMSEPVGELLVDGSDDKTVELLELPAGTVSEDVKTTTSVASRDMKTSPSAPSQLSGHISMGPRIPRRRTASSAPSAEYHHAERKNESIAYVESGSTPSAHAPPSRPAPAPPAKKPTPPSKPAPRPPRSHLAASSAWSKEAPVDEEEAFLGAREVENHDMTEEEWGRTDEVKVRSRRESEVGDEELNAASVTKSISSSVSPTAKAADAKIRDLKLAIQQTYVTLKRHQIQHIRKVAKEDGPGACVKAHISYMSAARLECRDMFLRLKHADVYEFTVKESKEFEERVGLIRRWLEVTGGASPPATPFPPLRSVELAASAPPPTTLEQRLELVRDVASRPFVEAMTPGELRTEKKELRSFIKLLKGNLSSGYQIPVQDKKNVRMAVKRYVSIKARLEQLN